MSFLDKAKAQAQQLAEKAQEGVKTGQDKIEEVQAARKADGLFRELGAAVFLEKTGRAAPETTATINRLVAELSAHEAEHGLAAAPKAGVDPVTGPPAGGDPGSAAAGGVFWGSNRDDKRLRTGPEPHRFRPGASG